LQRITAVCDFFKNRIPAYGHQYSEYEDQFRMRGMNFKFDVNNLKTRKEVLRWYLEINHQGTPHSNDELMRVAKLLDKEENK
ncbi:hypothetical protein LCGC14_1853890, partial [marine sediment metagenome]